LSYHVVECQAKEEVVVTISKDNGLGDTSDGWMDTSLSTPLSKMYVRPKYVLHVDSLQ